MKKRKTMRRTKEQAETLAKSLRAHGHKDIQVKRVSPTDWAITWTYLP